jgi:hypothetical protein
VRLLHQPFSTLPQPGDVLVATFAATTKFDVSIARSDGHLRTHQLATAKGRDLAQERRVSRRLAKRDCDDIAALIAPGPPAGSC